MTRGGTEVEATLRLAAGAGEDVEAALAGLDRIAGRRLRRRKPVVLEDAYLDTPETTLGRAGLALRARRAGGEWRVAVKGDERRLPEGGARRLEVERRWSPEAFSEIAGLLADRGVTPPGAGTWPDRGAVGDGLRGGEVGAAPPVETFEELGFEVVQRRRTRRRRSEILSADAPAGEIALDRVRYRIPSGRSVVHREVEVEGAGEGAERVVSEVTRALRRRFGEALRPWRHDKLATGRVLERLADLRELEDLVGPAGVLGERAYARVDEILRDADL